MGNSEVLIVVLLLMVIFNHINGTRIIYSPPPGTTTIDINRSMFMSCVAVTTSLEDDVIFSWSVNGNNIADDLSLYDFNFTTNNFTEGSLKYVSSTLWDCGVVNADKIGEYSCTVESLNKTSTATWNITIANASPAVVTSAPADITTSFGSTVTMSCETSGFPQPNIMFTKNGEVIEQSSRVIVTKNNLQPLFSLRINSFEPYDVGDYSCVSYNNVGAPDTSKLWSVTIDLDVRSPIVLALSANVEQVVYSSSVLVNCVAYGFPFPTITFSKDGITLDNSTMATTTEYLILEDGIVFTHSELILCDVRKDQLGLYTCTAQNNQGNHSLSWGVFGLIDNINECENGTHNCEQECHNTIGSFLCSCFSGYDLVNVHECIDIDECADGTHYCEQICHNTNGSYFCSCDTGYSLSIKNLYTCEDIDECASGTDNCDQYCVNTIGSYRCDCFSGYHLVDMHTCNDTDECITGSHNCDQLCTNTYGSFTCGCYSGYVLSPSDMHSCLAPPVVTALADRGSQVIGVQSRDGISGTITLQFVITNAIPLVKPYNITWTFVNGTDGSTVDVISTLVDNITDSVGDASALSGRFYMSTSRLLLTIFQLQRRDRGTYTLNARNTVGSSSATINLDVHIDPVVQVIRNLGRSLTLEEEENVSFECIADGVPPPSIVWLLNGTVVNSKLNNRYSITSNSIVRSSFRLGVPEATRSVLTVSNLHLSDAGEYTCRADPNVIGEPHFTDTVLKLIVNPRIIDYCQSQPCRNGGTCTNLENGYLCQCDTSRWKGVNCTTEIINDEPARIVSGPSIGSFPQLFRSVNLSCETTGSPQPNIMWYKNDVVLPNQHLSYLLIEEVRLSDRGKYYCKASNYVRDMNNPSNVMHHEEESGRVILNIHGIVQYRSVMRVSQLNTGSQSVTQVINGIIDSLSSYLSGSTIAGSNATVYSIVLDPTRSVMGDGNALILITLISFEGGSSFLTERLSERLEDVVGTTMELSSLSITFDAFQRFDGCSAEMTSLPPLSNEDVPIILEWSETSIGINQALQCPCGNLSALGGGVNRNAFRFCGGNFMTGGAWDAPLQLACNFSSTTRKLCQVTAIIDEPEEAVDKLEVLTENEEEIGALEIGITSVLLETLTEAVIEEQNRTLSESMLMIVDNILDVETDLIQQSQEESNASAKILEVVEQVTESIPIPENETVVVIPLSLFAVSVQEVDEESFEGVSFSALLGDAFEFDGDDEPIDEEQLVFEENLQATASITIPDDLFSGSVLLVPPPSSLNDSIDNMTLGAPKSRRRIVHSVYLNDALFVRRNESDFEVGSIVISASVSGGITIENLPTPITLQFLKSPAVVNGTNTTCSFWEITADDGFGNWLDRGCWVENETDETVTCACNHLTNFAILLDVSPEDAPTLPPVIGTTLLAVSYIGAILSIIFLVLTIATYASSNKLRGSVAGQILFNLCFALIGVYVMFIVAYHSTKVVPLCAVAGGLLHYFMLVTFAVMAAEAINLYIKLVQVLGCTAIQQRYVLKTTLISWTVPLIIVIVSLAPNYRNYVRKEFCRPYNFPFYLGFIAPFSLIYVMNWVIFIIIFIKLLRKAVLAKSKNKLTGKKVTTSSKVKQQLVIAITLSLLFGLGWGAGLPATNRITSVPVRAILQALFIFLTGFQGVFVFIMHCLRSEEARKEWTKWFMKLTCQKSTRSKRLYGSTSTGTSWKNNPYSTLSTSAGSRSSNWAESNTLKRVIEKETSSSAEPLQYVTATEQARGAGNAYVSSSSSSNSQSSTNPETPLEESHIYDTIPEVQTQNSSRQRPRSKSTTKHKGSLNLDPILELDEQSESSFNTCANHDQVYVNVFAQEESDFREQLRMLNMGNLTEMILSYLTESSIFWTQSDICVEEETEMN